MIPSLSFRRARPLAAVAALALAATPLLGGSPAGAAASAADQQIAKAGLVVAADLGTGWTQKPHKSSGGPITSAQIKKLPSCAAIAKSKLSSWFGGKKGKGAEAQSADFSQRGYTINDDVTVFPQETPATAAMTVVSSPTFSGCMGDTANLAAAQVRKQLGSKVTDVTASVAPTALQLPADQEAGIGMLVTARLTAGGAVQSIVILDFVRVGRAVVAYEIERAPGATGTISTAQLVPSIQRMRAALGG